MLVTRYTWYSSRASRVDKMETVLKYDGLAVVELLRENLLCQKHWQLGGKGRQCVRVWKHLPCFIMQCNLHSRKHRWSLLSSRQSGLSDLQETLLGFSAGLPLIRQARLHVKHPLPSHFSTLCFFLESLYQPSFLLEVHSLSSWLTQGAIWDIFKVFQPSPSLRLPMKAP